MKHGFATLLLIAGASLAPLGAHAANAVTEKASASKETIKESAADAKVTSEVKMAFAKDKAVSAMKIHVSTQNGLVKLSGNVKSPEEANKAVSIATNIKGVTAVTNEIQVGVTDTAKKDGIVQGTKDAAITTKVKSKFAADRDVSAMKIHVKTRDGIVHLTGNAKSDAEAKKAVDLAQGTEGVSSVRNEIHVTATGATR